MRGVLGPVALMAAAVMVGCTAADTQEGGQAKPARKRVMEMDRIHEMTEEQEELEEEGEAADEKMPDKSKSALWLYTLSNCLIA